MRGKTHFLSYVCSSHQTPYRTVYCGAGLGTASGAGLGTAIGAGLGTPIGAGLGVDDTSAAGGAEAAV